MKYLRGYFTFNRSLESLFIECYTFQQKNINKCFFTCVTTILNSKVIMSRLDNKAIVFSTDTYMCYIGMYRKCLINNIERLMLFCLKALKGDTQNFGKKNILPCVMLTML